MKNNRSVLGKLCFLWRFMCMNLSKCKICALAILTESNAISLIAIFSEP